MVLLVAKVAEEGFLVFSRFGRLIVRCVDFIRGLEGCCWGTVAAPIRVTLMKEVGLSMVCVQVVA